MFNGIIFHTGIVEIIKNARNSKLIGIRSNLRFKTKDVGSSISCDGVCLTLTKINKNLIFFYLSSETIKRSSFKNLKIGKIVNLENL